VLAETEGLAAHIQFTICSLFETGEIIDMHRLRAGVVVVALLLPSMVADVRCQTTPQSAAQPIPKITPPKPVSTPTPDYPEDARRLGIQGTVDVHFTVGVDGKPYNITVKKSLTPELDEAAIKGVSKWRFKPATKDRHPIDDEIDAQVSFRKAP
jgi:periplasmic protein TonB